MALIDQWRSQRHQRQLENRDRKATEVTRSAAVRTHIQSLTARRQLASQELHDNLQQFRQDLARSDTNRRQEARERQARVQAAMVRLQQSTQEFLQRANHSRQEQHQALQQEIQTFIQHELVEFIEDLRLQITAYFRDLEALRQQRQQEIQERKEELEENLQHYTRDRQNRAKVQQAELAQLMEFLHNYRLNLYQSVWGDGQISDLPPLPNLPSISPIPEPTEAEPTTAAPSLSSPAPAQRDKENVNFSSTEEEQVYNFLQQSPASRLSNIEAALGINRIQAVDTLRSLIKQGLVTQRDRLYSTL